MNILRMLPLITLTLSSCMSTENRWSSEMNVPARDYWSVIYANQRPNRLDTLIIERVQCKNDASPKLQVRLTDFEPDRGPDGNSPESKLDTGPLDLSIPGSRRYLRAESGTRISVRSDGGVSCIRVKMTDTKTSRGSAGN